jgi:hypothetical protein
MKPGFAVGVAFQSKLAGTLQPEALFITKGSKYKADFDGITETEVVKINYLEVPILAQFLIPAGAVTPVIYAGPAFAFKMGKPNAVIDNGDETQELTDDQRDLMNDAIKGFDFGIATGAGLGINAGPGQVVIDIRYTLGFIKPAKLTVEMKNLGAKEDDLSKDKNIFSLPQDTCLPSKLC